jgi:hypothetical protein
VQTARAQQQRSATERAASSASSCATQAREKRL